MSLQSLFLTLVPPVDDAELQMNQMWITEVVLYMYVLNLTHERFTYRPV